MTTVPQTRTMNLPVRFEGTDEEARRNRNSHAWQVFQYSEDDAEEVCILCDAKPWHKAAEYPCGTHVPREIITTDMEGNVISKCRSDA